MKTKKNISLLIVICFSLLIMVMTWTVFADNSTADDPSNEYENSIIRGSGLEWSPVGTWIVTVPTPMGDEVFLHMINAQDTMGTRYGGILWQVNSNPTNFGMFPEAEDGSLWAAQTVRTAKDSFETTMLAYSIKKGEEAVAETVCISIVNAKWTLTGPNTNEGEATLAVYSAAQDVNRDGFPDGGQEPVTCMTFTFTSRRLTMMPDCVPTPLPE